MRVYGSARPLDSLPPEGHGTHEDCRCPLYVVFYARLRDSACPAAPDNLSIITWR